MTQMVVNKNRNANFRLNAKERKQLLIWGSILILAMICLIYLITPAPNSQQPPATGGKQTGTAHWNSPVSA